ncbi:MAG: hypothetical protein DMF49_07060 [Acidobacteria bacterium]|nr:MAG: hypothetical protein DMF49_07060 [Acidobacteriota bacterium]
MMRERVLWLPCVLTLILSPGSAVLADESQPSDMQQLKKEVSSLRDVVERLDKKVAEQQRFIDAMMARLSGAAPQAPVEAGEAADGGVTAEQVPPPEPTTPTPPTPAPLPQPSPAPAAASPTTNYFNPSVSVIGNFLGVAGHNPSENLPSANLRESELALQAIVDPYARADFFLSFGEEGVGVEEGFLTFNTLPLGLLAKVGRMRASFGKINPLHLHVLPWPDEPLPVVNLLGGEEVWIGTGLSVARLVPLPGDIFSEATLQVFRGESEGLFSAPTRGDLAYLGRYRLFHDLTESTNLDVGLTYASGPNGASENSRTHMQGFDATLRWKPLRTATYRSVTFRTEYIRSRREEIAEGHPSGWFLSGEWQFMKRWFAGARWEQANHPDDASTTDRGQALLLTFWPSEFSQLRGELRRRDFADAPTALEGLLQLQFSIGAHGAHPF